MAEWTEVALRALSDGVLVLDASGVVRAANPPAVALGAVVGSKFEVPLEDRLIGGRVIAASSQPVAEGGVVVVLRDLTDRVIAARRAELAKRRAEYAIEAASLAHQINNPLAIINVHAELMKDELETLRARHRDDAKRYGDVAESMTEIENAVAAIIGLTADLRAFSQALPNAKGDLRRAVDWAVRTAAPALRDRARATVKLAANGLIAVEEPKLGRLLLELLRNAAAAIPPGAADTQEVIVSSRAAATPGRVVIEIRDAGTGLTEPPTFAPVLRATPSGIHVGLGLAECRAIVDAAGGALKIDSTPGSGTTVTIELPLRG